MNSRFLFPRWDKYRLEARSEKMPPETSIKYFAVSRLLRIAPNILTPGYLKMFEAVWCVVSSRLFEHQHQSKLIGLQPQSICPEQHDGNSRSINQSMVRFSPRFANGNTCRIKHLAARGAGWPWCLLLRPEPYGLLTLVPVGHSLSRALSDTSCGTPYSLPNEHHLALFTFLARSHATNMPLCPDYPYGSAMFCQTIFSGPSAFVSQRLHTLRSFSHALERGSVSK